MWKLPEPEVLPKSVSLAWDARAMKHRDGVLRVIVTGGGTGGHVFPVVAAVRELRQRDVGSVDVLWIGAADSLEARTAAGEGIAFAAVATGKLRRSSSLLGLFSAANVKDMIRVPLGVFQARRLVRDFEPDVVLAAGGYVAVPVGLAAAWCGRRLVVHEQTVRIGLANRLLARVAARVAVSSSSTVELLPRRVRSRTVVTGNPVRPEILAGEPDKAVSGLGLHGFDRCLPTVYVTGGAQGSVQINTLVAQILPWLVDHANVLHQCGTANVDQIGDVAGALDLDAEPRYRALGYIGPELPDVLALADVMVSRAGAGTIAEITAAGKAAVLIPLASSAGNEQAHNARHLAEAGAAVALLGEVTADRLREELHALLSDDQVRVQVAARAADLGRPDAASRLAVVVLEVAGRTG